MDVELLGLLNRLTKVQNEVGGAKGKSGINGDHVVTLDRFQDLKEQMTERLLGLKENFEAMQLMQKTPGRFLRVTLHVDSQHHSTYIKIFFLPHQVQIHGTSSVRRARSELT